MAAKNQPGRRSSSSTASQVLVALIGALASIAVAYLTATSRARSESKTEVASSLMAQSQEVQRITSKSDALDNQLSTTRQHLEAATAELIARSTKMYYLWVTIGTGQVPMNKWGDSIAGWNRPEQEYPIEGAFNRNTGTWTCPKSATYLIVLRLAIEPISGAAINAGIEINGRRVSNAYSSSSASRGAVAVFAKKLIRGDTVTARGQCENFTGVLTAQDPLSSLMIAQVTPY